MRQPNETELIGLLKRLAMNVVVSDPYVIRREDQLRELLHILLVKLESDVVDSRLDQSLNHSDNPVNFRIHGDSAQDMVMTVSNVRRGFKAYFHEHRNDIFNISDRDELLLSDETIFAIVTELGRFRILGVNIDSIIKAFQIFRSATLRNGEGQYLTHLRVVQPAVRVMEITTDDKVIDPACGSGTFIVEILRQTAQREFHGDHESHQLVNWARENLYGIDRDDIGVKLTKAIITAMYNGAVHVLLGDVLRSNLWSVKYPFLVEKLGLPIDPFGIGHFTVAITNPPFGESLKVRAADCQAAGYTISTYAAMKGPHDHISLEIGLIYLEQCYRLLCVGGRVGIILPETYFFSYSYRWLPYWLNGRLALRGMMNIPMEAFEEYCRAKTNFYIFEKVGNVETAFDSSNIQGKVARKKMLMKNPINR